MTNLRNQLGLVLFVIKDPKATSFLSDLLYVDLETVSTTKTKVWTEIGFDSELEAKTFVQLSQYRLEYLNKRLGTQYKLDTIIPSFKNISI